MMSEDKRREQTDRNAIREALKRTRLFADLPDEVIEELCVAGTLKAFENGECVARFGDPPSGIVVIAEGSVETSRSKANGQRLIYDFSQAGQVTGIFSTFDGGGWPLDNHARGHTKIVVIPGDVFLDVIRRTPELSIAMIAMMCRRNRMDFERMLTTGLDPARVQIAKVLLYFTRGPQSNGAPVSLPVRMSQDEVGEILGLSRQCVNKELSPLIRDGILAWRHGKIDVLDYQRLMAVAAEQEPLSADLEKTLFGRSPEHFRTSD